MVEVAWAVLHKIALKAKITNQLLSYDIQKPSVLLELKFLVIYSFYIFVGELHQFSKLFDWDNLQVCSRLLLFRCRKFCCDDISTQSVSFPDHIHGNDISQISRYEHALKHYHMVFIMVRKVFHKPCHWTISNLRELTKVIFKRPKISLKYLDVLFLKIHCLLNALRALLISFLF